MDSVGEDEKMGERIFNSFESSFKCGIFESSYIDYFNDRETSFRVLCRSLPVVLIMARYQSNPSYALFVTSWQIEGESAGGG